MYTVNAAQHTPRQLEVKSSIKYYTLFADSLNSHFLIVCVVTEKKMTSLSYCLF